MTIDNVIVTTDVTNVEVTQAPATNLTVTQQAPLNVTVATAGIQGAIGPAPTISSTIPVTTGAAGSAASGSVTGSNPYTINLTIPRGDTGATGPAGPAPTVSGTVPVTTGAAGSAASATITGTNPYTLNLTIPRGDQGIQGIQGIQGPIGLTGPAPTINASVPVTTGAAGSSASASITGSNPYTINLTIPRGDTGATGGIGPAGPPPTLNSSVSVTTGAAGSSASAAISGSNPYSLALTIPRGDTGATGAAATITPGTTTTLSPGASATVTNVGTTGAAVFNFGIPQGIQGPVGPTGPTGAVVSGTAPTDHGVLWIDTADNTDGVAVVIVTAAEYAALSSYAPNTIYVVDG